MRNKRYFFFFLSISVFLFGACNFPVASPVPESITITASLPPIIPTNTVPPTFMALSSVTATVIQPTPTLTLFYDPTITSTPSWMNCPLIITRNDTNSGDFLHILRCEDNLEYDLGPFAKGTYAAGPNNKFIVYVTDDGMIYAAKIGEQYLSIVANLVRERFFIVINKKVLPKFIISFTGEAPYYKMILIEKKYKQQSIYNLPVHIQE